MLAFTNSGRIFRGGVQVRESATHFSRPSPTPLPSRIGLIPRSSASKVPLEYRGQNRRGRLGGRNINHVRGRQGLQQTFGNT